MPQTMQNKSRIWLRNTSVPLIDSTHPGGNRMSPPKRLILIGAGFGNAGPDICIFDRFSSGKAGDLILPTRAADIGAWKKIGTAQPRYYAFNGRLWMAGRDTSNLNAAGANNTGLLFYLNDYFTQFRYSHRVRIPPGFYYPGAAAENVFPANSTWKMSWFADVDANGNFIGYDEQDQSIHDLCIPTSVGGGAITIGGNTTKPKYFDTNPSLGNVPYMGFSHGQDNVYAHYQDGAESTIGARDKRMEGTWFRGNQVVGQYARLQSSPFYVEQGTQANVGYRAVRTTGWFGSAASFANVLPLYSDIYLAIGPNSRACVWVTDHPVFANSTRGYLLPVVQGAWSNTAIETSIADHEKLGFYHVQPVIGPMIENVTGVIQNA